GAPRPRPLPATRFARGGRGEEAPFRSPCGKIRMAERIMGPGRLEAFSDGVIAILITIMVLELKVPASHEPAALLALWPVMLSYLLSFLVVAIYWVNHHRLFHHAREVNNLVLWTNMAFLFCISLIPFGTAYMGENRFTPFSTALYAGS